MINGYLVFKTGGLYFGIIVFHEDFMLNYMELTICAKTFWGKCLESLLVKRKTYNISSPDKTGSVGCCSVEDCVGVMHKI